MTPSNALRLFEGQVFHRRTEPVIHEFSYPCYALMVHESAWNRQHSLWPLLGIERTGILSLNIMDYLCRDSIDLGAGIQRLCEQHEAVRPTGDLWVLTMPRLFGYVFNPVTFYLFCSPDSSVQAIVCEVNNTFGERHHYLSLSPCGQESDGSRRFSFPKKLYVSPFFPISGDYELLVSPFSEGLSISVRLSQGGVVCFMARLQGAVVPCTRLSLVRVMLTYPLAILGVMARIHWQAVRLFLQRGLRYAPKPKPDRQTIVSPMGWVERARLWVLRYIVRSN